MWDLRKFLFDEHKLEVTIFIVACRVGIVFKYNNINTSSSADFAKVRATVLRRKQVNIYILNDFSAHVEYMHRVNIIPPLSEKITDIVFASIYNRIDAPTIRERFKTVINSDCHTKTEIKLGQEIVNTAVTIYNTILQNCTIDDYTGRPLRVVNMDRINEVIKNASKNMTKNEIIQNEVFERIKVNIRVCIDYVKRTGRVGPVIENGGRYHTDSRDFFSIEEMKANEPDEKTVVISIPNNEEYLSDNE